MELFNDMLKDFTKNELNDLVNDSVVFTQLTNEEQLSVLNNLKDGDKQ